MICENCKAVMKEDDAYCHNCGASRGDMQTLKCWKCGRSISKADAFCRYCGVGQGKNVSFYYTHLGVWFLFIFILPFAVIFVWRSPVISKTLKWIYTAIMVFLTLYFCYSFYMAVNTVFNEYSSIFNLTI